MTQAIKRTIAGTRKWLDQMPIFPDDIATKLLDGGYPAVQAFATSPIVTFRGKIYEMFSKRGTREQFENLLNDTNRPIILFQVTEDFLRLPTQPQTVVPTYKVRFADIL